MPTSSSLVSPCPTQMVSSCLADTVEESFVCQAAHQLVLSHIPQEKPGIIPGLTLALCFIACEGKHIYHND